MEKKKINPDGYLQKTQLMAPPPTPQGAAPSPLLIATGEAIPLRGLEGVPGLPGVHQLF